MPTEAYRTQVSRSLPMLCALVLLAVTVRAAEEAASTPRERLAKLAVELKAHPERFKYSDIIVAVAREGYPEVDKDNGAAFERELDRLAAQLKERLEDANSGRAKVLRLNEIVVEKAKLRVAPEATGEMDPDKERTEPYFGPGVLQVHQGVCLGLTQIYLCLGERAGLPLAPVRAPEHIFVHYDDGKYAVDIECTDSGRLFNRADLAQHFEPPADGQPKVYFEPVGKLDLLADMLNALAWFSALKKLPRPLSPEDNVALGKLCVELSPNDFETWDTLAEVYRSCGKHQDALETERKALTFRPKYAVENATTKKKDSFWKKRLEQFEAEATKIDK